MKKQLNVLMCLSMLGLAYANPANAVSNTTAFTVGAIAGGTAVACAPTIINTTKAILNDAWQRTKRAATTCARYTAYVGTLAAGGLGLVKATCGKTSLEKACGTTLLLGATAAAVYMAYQEGRNNAPRPAHPAAPGGPPHAPRDSIRIYNYNNNNA